MNNKPTRKEIRAALNRVPRSDERTTILSGAAQTARLQLTDAERALVDAQAARLKDINNVGDNTAYEILAALGRLLEEKA
jgi:hypothetical protein